MSDLLSNPELIRSARAQLRPGRMLTAAGICALLSLAVGYAMAHSAANAAGGAPGRWAMRFLGVVLISQVVALLLGGGIACLYSIQREKDRNTFDFQRVTRLSPLELALGKLFGAPILAYFIVLCLMPAALFGAVYGHARPSFVLAAYVVLLLGSIVYHAFALLISLVIGRGTAAAAVLLFLLAMWTPAIAPAQTGAFNLGRLSPFFAGDLIEQQAWSGPELSPAVPENRSRPFTAPGPMDEFFKIPVHHFFVLVFLYASFTAWFMLAVARNIKRDPAGYELFSPAQALGLALYINLLLLGFCRWKAFSPLEGQSLNLAINIVVFLGLGLVLLRNRDRLRRGLRTGRSALSGWAAAVWPAPPLLLGTLLVGAAALAIISRTRNPAEEWDIRLAVFRLLFFAFWLVRDLQYLQWMNLRRARRPLPVAFLYLTVFYLTVSIVVAMLDLGENPYTAIFMPTPVFVLTAKLWAGHAAAWTLALVSQALIACLFAVLQRRKVTELAGAPPHPEAAIAAGD